MKSLLSILSVMLLCGVCVAQDDAAEMTEADQLQIAVQKICPVSGNELGADSIKTSIEGETFYLCCDGCSEGAPNADHMAAIHARRVEAQAECPMMPKPVTSESPSGLVNGQRVWVCCPRCARGLDSRGEDALEKVNVTLASYVAAEQAQSTARLYMMAQGICPVSGQALAGQEAPITVQHNDQMYFLCCGGCEGKDFNEEHVATINANFAGVQKFCPVGGESREITVDSPSQLYNGVRVWTCCDACAEKFAENPEEYVEVLQQQYAAAAAANAGG
ncbi:MAG: hypothetical protein AAF456_19710 [Planctomycetota bacterium]